MDYGVNARQRWKQVRTIQIIIVIELSIQMRWFMELMLGNVGNKLEPFKYPLRSNQENKLNYLFTLMLSNVGYKFEPFK